MKNKNSENELLMRSIIQRIATGPELSKDISREEARQGMDMILEQSAQPVQAAIFLIALRMKRESDDEMKGLLDALINTTLTTHAEVDEVVAIADPYDGYNRTLPASPFLPPVLAACGVHAVTEGVRSVGPKFGVSHHRVMEAAGIPVNLSPQAAAERLENEKIGWSYIDQSQFCPPLYALMELRSQIVKRPSLTTLDVLCGPVRGKLKTHLVTGYVHKPYPRIYAMLARHADFDSALLVRGVEGGVVPSLRQAGKCFFYHSKGEEQSVDLDPLTLGIDQSVRAVPLPDDLPKSSRPGDEIAIAVDIKATAKAAADAGIEALRGEHGPVRDSLIYSGALILWHLRRFGDLNSASAAVREVLDSGKALAHLEAARG